MSRVPLVAAAYVALRRGEEVLLHLRQHTGYMDGHWALLAGHLEPGETIVEAALREAREEGGVVVEARDLLAVTTMHRLDRGGPPVEQRADFFFQAWRWQGEPRVAEPDKSAEVRWFPLSQLPEPMPPHERDVLERLAAGGIAPAIAVRRANSERYPRE